MIFYFSGTGNSKWVAEQLASRIRNVAVDLVINPRLGGLHSLNGQVVGVVFPVHAWGVPEPVVEFVRKLSGKPAFSFGVGTCGSEAGLALKELGGLMPLDSSYTVRMPNNYVVGSELESAEEIALTLAQAMERLDRIAEQVLARQAVEDVQTGNIAWIKSTLFHAGFNFAARRTGPFFVTDKCNSCGLCASICPAQTITMVEGKPVWGKKCYQCMACINLCPTAAIEYGKGTARRGRYRIEDYLEQPVP